MQRVATSRRVCISLASQEYFSENAAGSRDLGLHACIRWEGGAGFRTGLVSRYFKYQSTRVKSILLIDIDPQTDGLVEG